MKEDNNIVYWRWWKLQKLTHNLFVRLVLFKCYLINSVSALMFQTRFQTSRKFFYWCCGVYLVFDQIKKKKKKSYLYFVFSTFNGGSALTTVFKRLLEKKSNVFKSGDVADHHGITLRVPIQRLHFVWMLSNIDGILYVDALSCRKYVRISRVANGTSPITNGNWLKRTDVL